MGFHRGLAVAAAVGPALLGVGRTARCEGGGADPEFTAARAGAAARLVEYADWRWEHAPQVARNHYQVAAQLDPANQRAVEGAHGKPKGAGGRPSKGPPVRAAPKVDPKVPSLEEVTSTQELAYREAAVPLSGVATARAARKDESGARDAWLAVVSLDPRHEAARTALGLERAETGWLRPGVAGPTEAMTRYRSMPLAGDERLPAPSEEESWRSRSEGEDPSSQSVEARFRAKSYDREVQARWLLRDMLRTEAFLQGSEVIPARSRADLPFRFVLMASKAALDRAIDARSDRDEIWKTEHRVYWSIWWEANVYMTVQRGPGDVVQDAVHMTSHFLLADDAGTAVPNWLDEGVSYVAATALGLRPNSTCVEAGLSYVPRELGRVGDWDEAARRLVAEGQDPPFGQLARARANEFTPDGFVKCRSLVFWLIVHCPKALRRLAAASAHAPSTEDLCLRILGATPEAVDRHWRLWALRP